MRYAVNPAVSVYRQVPIDTHTRPMAAAVGTALYRLYGEAGDLLYVGVSSRPRDRWYSHSRRAEWWPQVAVAEVSEWRRPEYHARMAETHAIAEERPRYNRAKVAAVTEGSRITHGGLTEPSLTTPIGKGREGKGREKEGNATAILSVVDGGEIALHLKSLTGPTNAMQGVESWL